MDILTDTATVKRADAEWLVQHWNEFRKPNDGFWACVLTCSETVSRTVFYDSSSGSTSLTDYDSTTSRTIGTVNGICLQDDILTLDVATTDGRRRMFEYQVEA